VYVKDKEVFCIHIDKPIFSVYNVDTYIKNDMTEITFSKVRHDEAHPEFEYNQIDDNIWIGTNKCCEIGFDKELIDQGVTADISLEEERLDAAQGADYFLWLPTKDHTPPTQEKMRVGVGALKSLVNEGVNVYVHCQNGHGRAPTLVAAYYVSQGMSVENAIQKIQDKRPTIHLDQNQIDALDIFKNNL